MEGKHRTLHPCTAVRKKSSVSLSLSRGPNSPFKAPPKTSSLGWTCNCREEGPKCKEKTVRDFKDTLLSFDEFSEIDWLLELIPLCPESQAFKSMGNQHGTKENLTEDELYGPQIFKRRRRAKERDNKNNFHIKMALMNSLKVKKQTEQMNYLKEEKEHVSTKWTPVTTNEKMSIRNDFEEDLASDEANQQNPTSMWNLNRDMQFSHSPKSLMSTIDRNKEEMTASDYSEYDNEIFYEAKNTKSPGTSQTVNQRSLQLLKDCVKEMAALCRLSLTSSDLTNEDGEFTNLEQKILKTLHEYECKDINLNDSSNRQLQIKELRALVEAIMEKETEAQRRPQHLPVKPSYSQANCYSTYTFSPISSPLLIQTSSTPEPQNKTKKIENATDDLENYSNTNEQWMNWMKDYGHIYIEATDRKDSQEDLLDSDEALRRQEEVWQQEVEDCLCLSHPSRPQHVDFLHLTALEDEDISPTPSPPPPPPFSLSPELGSERSTDAEDRTPGRLQAVWPPLQDEEKVGLKYTEAEHQAALLQLKRECKDDLEKLQEDYAEELCRLKEESDDSVARLEFTVIELQSRLSQSESRRHGEVRDASVSTGDDGPYITFRNVCTQTDRETFVKISDNEDGRMNAQKVEPQKLDIDLFSLSLLGQNDDHSSLDHKSLTAQSHSINDPISPFSHSLNSNPQIIPPPPPLPPPPPPLPQSGPGGGPLLPPPPLPHGCGVTSVDKAPRKPTVEPSRPMKPLYWTRIQIQENNKETVWNILEETKFNMGDFEDLFAKTSTQMKRKVLSEAYGKKTKTRKIVKLLDRKRSQTVGILISSLHLDMKDIQHAVLTVDNSVVDIDTIEALYENRAQPDELGRIKKVYETSNKEDIKLLDKPEQFLYELSQIPDFAGRAQCVIFQSAFLDGIASTQRKLQAVSSVCEVLWERPSVKQIMGLVLALGNYMNGGSRTRGQADGFGLEILPKLKDVKSRDNRISLVDYVVSYYLRNVDKNAETDKNVFPLPEPQDVFLAAQVKFEELHKDLRQLIRDLTQCEKNIQKVCSNSSQEHLQPFKDKMEAFVIDARKEHGEASIHLMTIERSFQDLVVYFGLKPKAGDEEVTTSYFFMLWFEFCSDFKVRWKKESKNISKERLKEAHLSVKRITSEKKVETRKINPNSLKERLRQKEANLSSI